ncbi:hypothetical protein NDU88_011157 [Pleurodeles waltl]|uniref:Uncharacterized protein n=1 Tax=Pleurodeles waltl TaxID=8319 RepID=A0AAV7QXT8_PLEWA|nr:hypothetical protein NDU88_011157 [Pleurodeles waltl]
MQPGWAPDVASSSGLLLCDRARLPMSRCWLQSSETLLVTRWASRDRGGHLTIRGICRLFRGMQVIFHAVEVGTRLRVTATGVHSVEQARLGCRSHLHRQL